MRKGWIGALALMVLLAPATVDDRVLPNRMAVHPMEGFDAARLGDALDLTGRGLAPDVLVALGRSAPDDPAARWPKIRQEADSLILRV